MAKRIQRSKSRDSHRRGKKKVSILSSDNIDYVDWKDAELLRRFLSDRSKIRARRVTGNSEQQQKMCADAIKIAREMALLPYTTRVTTQRSQRGERLDRAEDDDGTRGRRRGDASAPSDAPERDSRSPDRHERDTRYRGGHERNPRGRVVREPDERERGERDSEQSEAQP